MPISDEAPRTNKATIGEVPVTNLVLDGPPRRDCDGADVQVNFANT